MTNITTPPQIVWLASGSPVVHECVAASGRCYVCVGELTRGELVTDWLGSSFTDQNRARYPTATHVCESCCYVHSRTAPVPGRPAKEGKKFGGNFRNYSHLWDERGYANASKGEKPMIREFLAREHAGPWFAAIADSGQKHVLPFAPMNGPGRSGSVLMDEQLIQVPQSLALVDAMTELLTLGVTKDELARGEYYVRTMRDLRDPVHDFEWERGGERYSGWFTLALWLAQRDEEEHARHDAEKKTRDDDRRNADRASSVLPKRAKRAATDELLAADTGSGASGGAADSKRQRMGKLDAAPPPNRKPAQGVLKGFD